jgi:hypothetical protein
MELHIHLTNRRYVGSILKINPQRMVDLMLKMVNLSVSTIKTTLPLIVKTIGPILLRHILTIQGGELDC